MNLFIGFFKKLKPAKFLKTENLLKIKLKKDHLFLKAKHYQYVKKQIHKVGDIKVLIKIFDNHPSKLKYKKLKKKFHNLNYKNKKMMMKKNY